MCAGNARAVPHTARGRGRGRGRGEWEGVCVWGAGAPRWLLRDFSKVGYSYSFGFHTGADNISARVRGWEGEPGISGSRETWGLSRLVTPAVVA